MNIKPFVTYGVAILFLIVVMFLLRNAIPGLATPQTTTETFSQALWGTWGAAIIIVSFILFAGGAGILVLLGGGWRWE
jgi:hypothetical protein